MTWLDRQRLRSFLVSSGWVFPILALVAGWLLFRLTWWVDQSTQLNLLSATADGARAIVGSLVSAILTFIVFAFSILLIAIQLVSTSLSPRIIALVYQSRPIRRVLAIFVLSFTYLTAALGRIGDPVPQLCVITAVALSVISIGAFVVLVDIFGKSLRPVSLLSRIGNVGSEVVYAVYPLILTAGKESPPPGDVVSLGAPERVIERSGNSGIVIGFDAHQIRVLAERADCVIELIPQVGDFVAKGDPLFYVFGPRASEVAEAELAGSIAFGAERTFSQDPLFAFRIIVDVAAKALSPAINDPTTAVLAIDQLHRLLRAVGRRQLDTGIVRDIEGRVRLVYRTPDWDDFLRISVTEIRHFGANSIQVARRMRSMLENLAANLPDDRARLTLAELDKFAAAVDRAFPDEHDRRMASIADSQGLGSPLGRALEEPLRTARPTSS